MAGSPAYARMRDALYDRLADLAAGQVVRLDALAEALNLPPRHVASILARISPGEDDFCPWWRVIPSVARFPALPKRSRRQQVQVERLLAEGLAISGDGVIADLENRLVAPDMRDARRVWLEPDENS